MLSGLFLLEEKPVTPKNGISHRPVAHSKAKSLDFAAEAALEGRKSNDSAGPLHCKSHFSHFELEKLEKLERLEKSKDSIFEAGLESELEKVVLLQKPKIRRIIKKSLLMILKSRMGPKSQDEGPSRETGSGKKPSSLRLEIASLEDFPQEDPNLFAESKSAHLPSSPNNPEFSSVLSQKVPFLKLFPLTL